MAAASSFARTPTRGRVLIYVVGLEKEHWANFPGDIWRTMPAAMVDVRQYLPRDPNAQGKGKGKKKSHKQRERLIDDVVGMEGFVPATLEVVEVCIIRGRCCVGCELETTHPTT